MKDARLRQTVKLDYITALGRATYCFALCEWQVVWCCERIRPGTLKRIVDEKFTAGDIAKCFSNLVRNMAASSGRAALRASGTKFFELSDLRNQIIHGKPCTGPNGDSRLSASKVLEIEDLERAADEFSQCSIELNEQFYGFLSSYEPPDH